MPVLQLPGDWMLPDSHLYIRRLPWTYNPDSMYNTAGGYNASVTSVGSKHHSLQSATRAGRPAAGEVHSPTWSEVPSNGASVVGGAGEMSFDELLALSIAVSYFTDLFSIHFLYLIHSFTVIYFCSI